MAAKYQKRPPGTTPTALLESAMGLHYSFDYWFPLLVCANGHMSYGVTPRSYLAAAETTSTGKRSKRILQDYIAPWR